MVACVSEGTDGQCEYTDMGNRLRDNSAACRSRNGGGAGLAEGTTAERAEDEDGGRIWRWERGGEERTLAIGDVLWL